MKSDAKISLVFCTCPVDQAEKLAGELVERRLAACVNIVGPVTSVYRWKGEIERDTESLLIVKCRAAQVGALTDSLLEIHPYELPEVIAVGVEAGNPAYLRWVADETASGGEV